MAVKPETCTLDAATLLAERPFTHPARTYDDLLALNRALARLRAVLHSDLPHGIGAMQSCEWDDDQGNHQRILVRAGLNLRTLPMLYLVGFFGQRRATADRERMDTTDQVLVEEMAGAHSEIVCYYTAALESGEYGNMVLSTCESARDEWNASPNHTRAARELAPRYYRTIRLHNGVLDGGLRSAQGPALTVTKYYDYGDASHDGRAPWRGVRIWSPPARLEA